MTGRRSCRSLTIPQPCMMPQLGIQACKTRRVASWSCVFMLLPALRLLLCFWGETVSLALAIQMILIRTRNPTIPMRSRILPKSLLSPMTQHLRRRTTARHLTIAAVTTPTPHPRTTNRSEDVFSLTASLPHFGGRDANRQVPWLRIDLAGGCTYKPPNLHPLEIWREAHLSTISARPQAAARLPRPHGDQGRPQGAGTAQGQGA